MYKLVVLGVIVAAVLAQGATAQLSLSTTGGVQCYGEQVTLLCTHPVLPQEPEYLQAEPNWKRDGVKIISVDDFGHRKTLNSTTTKLEFTITENTVGNYTCYLVNAVQGGVDESNTIPVRPSNVSTSVVPSSTPSDTDQPDFDTPTDGGPSGGDTAAIIVPIVVVVVAAAAVVATLVGIFLWKKKNSNQSYDVTEEEPLLKECRLSVHKTGRYEALNCEDDCPNSEEKTEETELETMSPVEEEQYSSDRTSLVYICHSEQVQPPADPFRTEFQVELSCTADAGFQDTLDEDSQVTPLGCVTDETETLPFPVQETTCTIPEEDRCSLVTGVTAIWQESLDDQDMFVLPEPTFGQLLSSMTADETDEDLVIPEQEVTSVMVVPSSKLLSKSVVLSSAPPPTPGPVRCSAYRDHLPPDDIHSNGGTRLGSVHTDACELLKSEVKIPGNTSEPVDAPSAPFRNKLADDTVTTLSLPCSDAPVSFPMCAFPICVEEEEELPDLRSATPSDHHVTENLDVTDSISMDEPSKAHGPPESVNTNPQHVSRTDRWPRGGGSGKYSLPFQQDGFRRGRKSVLSKKQELLIVGPRHVVLCSSLVRTEGGNFSTAA